MKKYLSRRKKTKLLAALLTGLCLVTPWNRAEAVSSYTTPNGLIRLDYLDAGESFTDAAGYIWTSDGTLPDWQKERINFAAVTINENADPDVVRDFTKEINKIVPWEDGYYHAEGNSAAHLKSSIIGFSEQRIIDKGRLVLGTWQGIYFCEFDGPRHRHIYVKII